MPQPEPERPTTLPEVIEPVPHELVPQSVGRPVRRRKRRPAPPPPRRGCWGTCATYGGLALLVMILVLAFVVMVATIQVFDFLRDPLDNFLAVFGFDADAEPEVVDTRVIVLGIREMSVLQTASGDVQIVKEVVDTGPAPDAKLKISYIGSVHAGIDLSQISEADVIAGPEGTVTINLPPIQILDCVLRDREVLDSDCTEIPVVQDCDEIRNDLEDAAFKRSLDELLLRAQENEITTPNGEPLMEVAYRQAEAVLAELLESLGQDRVAFVRSQEIVPPAASCQP